MFIIFRPNVLVVNHAVHKVSVFRCICKSKWCEFI